MAFDSLNMLLRREVLNPADVDNFSDEVWGQDVMRKPAGHSQSPRRMCAPSQSRPPTRLRIRSARRSANNCTWSSVTIVRSTKSENSSRAGMVVKRSPPYSTATVSTQNAIQVKSTHRLAPQVRFAS